MYFSIKKQDDCVSLEFEEKKREIEMGKVIRRSLRALDRIKMEVRPSLLSIISKSVSRPLGFFKW